MISYIKGTVTDISENSLIIETGGIGYEIFVTAKCFSEYSVIDKTVSIFTYMNVKEDGVTLLGFYSKTERNMFKRLLTVSGVGPKIAMTILGGITVDALASSVASGNADTIFKIKGVGRKMAERIVLELKDKITLEFNTEMPKMSIMPDITSEYDDCIMTLISLGYSKAEAIGAISKIDVTGLSSEQIILKVLKG